MSDCCCWTPDGGSSGAVDSVQGSDGITPTTPQTGAVTLSGDALLPRNGSRPMTGNLNMGGNDIAGADAVFANVAVEAPNFLGLGGGDAAFNGVTITDGGAGNQFLSNDGTYKPVASGSGSLQDALEQSVTDADDPTLATDTPGAGPVTIGTAAQSGTYSFQVDASGTVECRPPDGQSFDATTINALAAIRAAGTGSAAVQAFGTGSASLQSGTGETLIQSGSGDVRCNTTSGTLRTQFLGVDRLAINGNTAVPTDGFLLAWDGGNAVNTYVDPATIGNQSVGNENLNVSDGSGGWEATSTFRFAALPNVDGLRILPPGGAGPLRAAVFNIGDATSPNNAFTFSAGQGPAGQQTNIFNFIAAGANASNSIGINGSAESDRASILGTGFGLLAAADSGQTAGQGRKLEVRGGNGSADPLDTGDGGDLILFSGAAAAGGGTDGNLVLGSPSQSAVWPSANAAGSLTNDGSGNLSWQPSGSMAADGLETFPVVSASGNQFMTNNTAGRLYCMAAIPEVSLTIANISFVIAQNNAGGTGGVGIYDGNGVRLAYSTLQGFILGLNNIALDQGGPINLTGGQLYYLAIEANINSCGPLSIQGNSVYNPPVGPNVPPLAFVVNNSRSVDPTGFPANVSAFFGQVGPEARKYYLLGKA